MPQAPTNSARWYNPPGIDHHPWPSNMLITRRLEFDSGHRIPDHQSQCRHLHGHRYAIEITLLGDIIRQTGVASEPEW